MEQITKEQVQKAVHAFLQEQYMTRTEKEQKQLIKAQEDSDYEKVASLQEKLREAREKYSLETWMADAANRMAKQLYFGTHISKGIHPDSKGDNINYLAQNTHSFAGSHNIKEPLLDANGNAAALPLAAFFEYAIDDKSEITISDAILNNIDGIQDVLSNNHELSKKYYASFYRALNGELKKPITHERNKQMLWLKENNSYTNIVPLYPSALTHVFSKKINSLRFSEENKTARENRFKKTADKTPYLSLNSIAVTKLGGTKPQNISLLTSRQGGRNYLLPSLPPQFKRAKTFKIQPYAESLFSKGLEFRCRNTFKALARLIKTQYNNVNIRNARKNILDNLLHNVLTVASSIQEEYPAGWSKEYSLHISEKYWLDPQRAKQDEDFAEQRSKHDWQQEITERFASWVNHQLKQQLNTMKHELADEEFLEWQREIQEMIKETQRQGMEVFQS